MTGVGRVVDAEAKKYRVLSVLWMGLEGYQI